MAPLDFGTGARLLDILCLRDHYLEALKNRLHRDDVSFDLLLERRVVRSLKDNLERPRSLLGRSQEDRIVALLDDSVVGLKVVDALVEIARKDTSGLIEGRLEYISRELVAFDKAIESFACVVAMRAMIPSKFNLRS
jgi:hypothetical protein